MQKILELLFVDFLAVATAITEVEDCGKLKDGNLKEHGGLKMYRNMNDFGDSDASKNEIVAQL